MPSTKTKSQLQLTNRETGKAAAKKLRRQGLIPGVVYGHGIDPVSVAFVADEFTRGSRLTSGPLLSVTMPDGKTARVLVRELRTNPLSGRLEHVDFQRVAAGESVRSEIRILLDDEQLLLKKGLVASWVQDHVLVEGPPEDLPEALHIQGGDLGFGDQVSARDLLLPSAIHLLTDADTVLLAVSAPKATAAEMPAAPAATETPEPAEPEVDAGQ